jgi:hypothetical protein
LDEEENEEVKESINEIEDQKIEEIPDKFDDSEQEESNSIKNEDNLEEEQIEKNPEYAEEEVEKKKQEDLDGNQDQKEQQREEENTQNEQENGYLENGEDKNNVNIFKEDSINSDDNPENRDLESYNNYQKYNTGKFPEQSFQNHFSQDEEVPKSRELKKLVPLNPSNDRMVRKTKFQESYEDIIDYSIPDESQNLESRVNRLKKQRERMKDKNYRPSQNNRERLRNISPEFDEDSEISQIYNNIKILSQNKKEQIGRLHGQHYQNSYSNQRNYRPNDYYDKRDPYNNTEYHVDNFDSFGNRNREDSQYSRSTLAKRQDVLNQTSKDYEINHKRKLSPKRSRGKILRKKKSQEELGDKVANQKKILNLQYNKNQILKKVERSISKKVLKDLFNEISQSFERTGSFTLMDSKRIQRNIFGNFDYYERKELPSLYKLIDVEVELLSRAGY